MSSSESYFPAHYRQARRNFIAACEAAKVDSIARVHPAAKGPDGKPLFLDSVAIGPRHAKKALLLIAGTHGVEGYFGSAAQTGLLRERIDVPQGTRVVMVHALNPFGFAWDRRVNEENIDLNRNHVDHSRPPDNPDYALLADAIVYEDAAPESVARADAKLAAYAQRYGAAKLQQAISAGQYRFPKGLHYGGKAESWSHKMLHAILGEDLAAVEKLVVIDFHTGLGTYGAGEMIVEDVAGSPAYGRAKAMWGSKVASSESGESVSARLTGTLDQAVADWLPKVELTYGALEVGTCPFPAMFDALRRDAWFHNCGTDQRLGAEIRRAMRDAFYPDKPDWKEAVFAHARHAVDGALAKL